MALSDADVRAAYDKEVKERKAEGKPVPEFLDWAPKYVQYMQSLAFDMQELTTAIKNGLVETIRTKSNLMPLKTIMDLNRSFL